MFLALMFASAACADDLALQAATRAARQLRKAESRELINSIAQEQAGERRERIEFVRTLPLRLFLQEREAYFMIMYARNAPRYYIPRFAPTTVIQDSLGGYHVY